MQADGGTIFLDEIGTSSPGMQVKLLRVLQELQFEQVGGDKTFKVDVRVILATNEDLADAVTEGRFRQDLYYRINVIYLELPSLRQRTSDIPLLAQAFLDQVLEDTNRSVTGFSDDALEALESYHWPGNIRELQNVVERAVLLGKGRSDHSRGSATRHHRRTQLGRSPYWQHDAQGSVRGAGASDHPRSARSAQLEPQRDRRLARSQSHDAL